MWQINMGTKNNTSKSCVAEGHKMKREDLPDILYDSYERYMGNNLNINTKSDIDIKNRPRKRSRSLP